jgi:hypothetical protein
MEMPLLEKLDNTNVKKTTKLNNGSSNQLLLEKETLTLENMKLEIQSITYVWVLITIETVTIFILPLEDAPKRKPLNGKLLKSIKIGGELLI